MILKRLAYLAVTMLALLASGCPPADVAQDPWSLSERDAGADATEDASVDVGVAPSGPLAERRECVPWLREVCPTRRQGVFGECGEELGYAFDGRECVPVTGCADRPQPGEVYSSANECASVCAAQGWCATDKVALAPRDRFECSDVGCWEYLYMCVQGEEDPGPGLEGTIVGAKDVLCMRHQGGGFCSLGENECEIGSWCCLLNVQFGDHRDIDEGVCAGTLLPEVYGFGCYPFG